jgi:hypothetical protein
MLLNFGNEMKKVKEQGNELTVSGLFKVTTVMVFPIAICNPVDCKTEWISMDIHLAKGQNRTIPLRTVTHKGKLRFHILLFQLHTIVRDIGINAFLAIGVAKRKRRKRMSGGKEEKEDRSS